MYAGDTSSLVFFRWRGNLKVFKDALKYSIEAYVAIESRQKDPAETEVQSRETLLMRIGTRCHKAFVLAFLLPSSALFAGELEPIQVCQCGRFLMTASGKPFFWLGDTCWHMFGKSVSENADNQPAVSQYFANRAAKGFTVIQSVIVRAPIGSTAANAYGHLPFEDANTWRPRLGPGPNDDYWDHVDRVMTEAKKHGLYMAALPFWLQDIPPQARIEKEPAIAYRYGHFLGSRYRGETHIIWVLGGDAYSGGRNVDVPSRLTMIRALAEGIADGIAGVDQFDGQADWSVCLMTFHPPGGGRSSGEWLHEEPWLDFNMIQTTTRFRFANWLTVMREYSRVPPKPVLDGEVAYEGSLSLRKDEPQDIRIGPQHVRRAAYWAVFAGACGHTYGHRSFIGWIRKGETYRYGASIPWYEVLDAPGAFQVGYLRRLIESRPFFTRIPDQSVLLEDHGNSDAHLQATRCREGSFLMVYSPQGEAIRVKTDSLRGPKFRAWWFNPRTGAAERIGGPKKEFEGPVLSFNCPTKGDGNDWVLILDSTSLPPPDELRTTSGQVPKE